MRSPYSPTTSDVVTMPDIAFVDEQRSISLDDGSVPTTDAGSFERQGVACGQESRADEMAHRDTSPVEDVPHAFTCHADQFSL